MEYQYQRVGRPAVAASDPKVDRVKLIAALVELVAACEFVVPRTGTAPRTAARFLAAQASAHALLQRMGVQS